MKIAFIGPMSRKLNGQRIAFEALKVLKGDFFDIYNLRGLFWLHFNVFKYDAVYITGSRSVLGFLRDLLFLFPFLLFNKKIIIHIHGDDLDRLSERVFIKSIFERVYNNSIVITCNSTQFLKYSKYFDFRFVDNFSRFIMDYNPVREKRRFLYISTVSVDKGIFVWLDIIEKLGNRYEYSVAGEIDLNKPQEELFFQRIESLQMKSFQIEYLGALNSEKLYNLMLKSTDLIYVSQHPTENMPLVLLEAASMKLDLHVTSFRELNNRFGLKTNSIDINDIDDKMINRIMSCSSCDKDFNFDRVLKNNSLKSFVENVNVILLSNRIVKTKF